MLHTATDCPTCGRRLPKSDFTVSLETNSVIAGGLAIKLWPKETEFLYALWRANGHVVSKPALMDAIYGTLVDYAPSNKILDVYAHRVREKISATGWTVKGYHSRGYALIRVKTE